MLTAALCGTGDLKQFRGLHALQRQYITDLQSAVCQSSGLIEGNGIYLAHILQGFAGLDDHAVLGCLSDRRHDGGRSRQYQCAGAKYHHNGNRTHDVPGEEIGENGNQQRHRHQPTGPLIGDPLGMRLILVRILHHADQLLQRAVFPHLSCGNVDRSISVDSAAENSIADFFIHRQTFTSHDGLIHRSFPCFDDAVHRDCLTRKDAKDITHGDLLHRNRNLFPVSNHSARLRRKRDQLFQPLFCPLCGHILQQRTNLHDESHFTRGEQVADQQRRDYGH